MSEHFIDQCSCGKVISQCRCGSPNKKITVTPNGCDECKSKMKTLTEFGKRLVTLNTGAQGLRGGLLCEVKEISGDAPCMDFIASDETLDRYDEVVSVDGWQLENFRKNPVIPDCHDYSSIGKILGRAQSIAVADGKLVNRVEFCLDNPMGSLAFKMAKGGFIKSQSVGFIPLEWTNGKNGNDGNNEPSRTYTKCELLEVSLVVVPANPSATIGLALKSGAIERKDLRDLAEYLKQFCSEEATPAGQAGASAGGGSDAQLLQIARSLDQALRGN